MFFIYFYIKYINKIMRKEQIEAIKRQRALLKRQNLGEVTNYNSIFSKSGASYYSNHKSQCPHNNSTTIKQIQFQKTKKHPLTLEEALSYIDHLEINNRNLHQQLAINKQNYTKQVHKLERKLKFKNELLQQCQKQIGYIKRQYSLIEKIDQANNHRYAEGHYKSVEKQSERVYENSNQTLHRTRSICQKIDRLPNDYNRQDGDGTSKSSLQNIKISINRKDKIGKLVTAQHSLFRRKQ